MQLNGYNFCSCDKINVFMFNKEEIISLEKNYLVFGNRKDL